MSRKTIPDLIEEYSLIDKSKFYEKSHKDFRERNKGFEELWGLEFENYYHTILYAMFGNQWDDALKACDSMIDDEPEETEAYGLRAEILSQMNRFDEVDEAYKTAIEKKPDYVNLCESYADTLFRMNRFVEAEKYYQLSSDSVQVLKKRAKTLCRINRFGEALEIYQEICRRNPNDAIAHIKAADILMKMEKLKDAFSAYTKAVKLNPYLERKYEALNKKIENSPGYFDLLVEDVIDERGLEGVTLEASTAVDEDKIRQLEKLKDNTEFAQTAMREGDACFAKNAFEAALVWYKKAYKKAPSNVNLLSNMAVACQNLEKYEDALRYFNEALKSFQHDEKVHKKIGDVYMKMGRYEEAAEAYKRSWEVNPYYLKGRYCYVQALNSVSYHDAKEKNAALEVAAEFVKSSMQSFSEDNIWYETLGKKLYDQHILGCDNLNLKAVNLKAELNIQANEKLHDVILDKNWKMVLRAIQRSSYAEIVFCYYPYWEALAYYKLNKLNKAQEKIEQCVVEAEYKSLLAVSYILKGCILLKKGDVTKFAEANELIQSGIKSAPEFSLINWFLEIGLDMVKHTLGVLCENHRYEDADAFLEEVKGTEEEQKQFKDILEGFKKEFGDGYLSEDEAEAAGSELDKETRNIGEKNKRSESEGSQIGEIWRKRLRSGARNNEVAEPSAKPGSTGPSAGGG